MTNKEYLELAIIEFEKEQYDDPNNEWLKRVIKGMKDCKQQLDQYDELMLKCKNLEKENQELKDKNFLITKAVESDVSNGELFKSIAKLLQMKVEKLEKALEIIKNKPQYELYLIQLGKIKNYNEYLEIVRDWDLEYGGDMEYTEEEFNLLREVFCNE